MLSLGLFVKVWLVSLATFEGLIDMAILFAQLATCYFVFWGALGTLKRKMLLMNTLTHTSPQIKRITYEQTK